MKKNIIAMILAGGQGSRLKALTEDIAKPAVPFGGRYRIIDFALSNCINSGIDVIGVLTQYKPLALIKHIGVGASWDLNRLHAGVHILSPSVKGKIGQWYDGTAHAIFENFEFINQYQPKYLLILSGDHIYKMNYSEMLSFHVQQNADITIAAMEVAWEEASRFGILNTNKEQQIIEFEEKPAKPKSNLASMGIYIFNWDKLEKTMLACQKNNIPFHDFGNDLLPYMLKEKFKIMAYPFKSYWKDVGTVASYWEANLDLITSREALNLSDRSWVIYTNNPSLPPQFVGTGAVIEQSSIANGCKIDGYVKNSMIFPGVIVEANAKVENSVIMGNSIIKKNSIIEKAVVLENCVVPENTKVGSNQSDDVAVYVNNQKD